MSVEPSARMWVDRHIETVEGDVIPNLWLAETKGNYINLTRPGYGTRKDYGNGSASVGSLDAISELFTPWCLLESPLLDAVRDWKF